MPDVIDLISSSPSPPPHKRPPAPGARRPGPANAPSALPPLSDHFDSFDDEPARKRHRPLAAGSPAPRPPLLARNAPSGRKARDPIDVSSSMEHHPSPAPRPPVGCRMSLGSPSIRRAASPRAPAVPVDSDPFASSPEPAAPAHHAPPRRAVSLDPFDCTPLRAAAPTRPTSRRRSPLTAGGAAIPARARDAGLWPPNVMAKSLGADLINIDSESSDASDGGELPDIWDLDVPSRPSKPRSPLRRSRSDTTAWASRPSAASSRKAAKQPVDREARAAAKAAEKERKRREREQAKEARARDKERAAALAEVNKLRTDKKVSAPEMIVDLPSALAPDHRVQVEVLLDGLGVEHATWDSPDQTIVKWRRKVTSRFDEAMDRWEPIPRRIQHENHVLAILTADFVDLVVHDELGAHVSQVRDRFDRHHVIYLLQGLTPWMRKNRNLRNRQFASGVRASQAPANAARAARGQRRSQGGSAGYIPEDQIEDALLRLQVEHDVFIHHTTIPVETARWVVAFTQHISTIPYKRQRDSATSAAAFFMETGQVRTGDDAPDTYVKMLQEIVRITGPIAYGVAAEFASVSKLVNGLRDGGPERLDGVRKCANKDGQLSDRCIGQAVSRRLHKVFTGRDEASTDV